MQVTQGRLYWLEKSKIKNVYPYITSNEKCDVLIIGGGLTGAITAYFLAKEGASVIVAEKNIIGYGCTSAIPATLEYELDLDLYKLEKYIGTVNARRVYELCLDALDKLEKMNENFESLDNFSRKDSICFTNKFMQKQSVAREFNIRKEAGFNIDLIQNHELINLNSGIVTKDSSGIMNPYLFTQDLIEYLSRMKNVKILENTEIIDLDSSYTNVVCKTNNNFEITASKVIIASGIDALKFIKNGPITVSKNFTIITKKIPELKKYNTEFTAKEYGESSHLIRFTDSNRIIYNGEEIKFNDKLLDEKYLNKVANEKYKGLYGSLRKTFSNLDNLQVEYGYNTTLVSTKDTLPIIDEVDGIQNCFFNLGIGTNGILYSVIGADMLKDAVKGYYTKDMNMFKMNRNE